MKWELKDLELSTLESGHWYLNQMDCTDVTSAQQGTELINLFVVIKVMNKQLSYVFGFFFFFFSIAIMVDQSSLV